MMTSRRESSNTTTVSKLDQFKACYKHLANPYSDKERNPIEDSTETNVQNGGSRQHEASDEMTGTPNRITTRAKLNYELYRYAKNAMLILSTKHESASCAVMVNELKRTFENFRFEVVVHLVSDPKSIYKNCQQFFRRDFTNYGAVALAIITSMAVNQTESCQHGHDMFIDESVIVENFLLDRNVTLTNKPKIYISVANHRTMGRSYHEVSRLDSETHGDVIGFHIPFSLPDGTEDSNIIGAYDSKPRLLKILCDKMAIMAGDHTLPKIIEETITAAIESFPLLKFIPIYTVNTLSRELYFARVENQ